MQGENKDNAKYIEQLESLEIKNDLKIYSKQKIPVSTKYIYEEFNNFIKFNIFQNKCLLDIFVEINKE